MMQEMTPLCPEERLARRYYLERSRGYLLNTLGRRDMQRALGSTAVKLKEQALNFYIPEISKEDWSSLRASMAIACQCSRYATKNV